MIQDKLDQMDKELERLLNFDKEVNKSITKLKDQMKIPKNKSPPKVLSKDPVLKQNPKYTLYTRDRFEDEKKLPKQAQENPLDESCLSMLSVTSALDLVKQKKQKNVIFPKSERFKKDEIDYRDYNTDQINAIKKKGQTVVINPLHKKQVLLTEKSVVSASQFDDLETQASLSQVPGPGQYNLNYNATEVQKAVGLPKAARFQELKAEEQSMLQIKYDQVLKSAPGLKIKNKSEKTKQQIYKEYEQKKLEVEQLKLQKKVPIDKTIKRKVPTAIMKKIESQPAGSKERRFMLFVLLDKINELRGMGPSEYNMAEQNKTKEPCMVRYRSVSPVERRGYYVNNKPVPGPDYYYCKDDLVYEKKPEWRFGIEERIKMPKLSDYDNREYNPLFDLVKERVVGGLIEKEHETEGLIPKEEELVNQKLGPGYYDQSYKLVEKRDDFGVPKFAELNEKNAREVEMDPLRFKEIFDNEDIDPNLNAVKPNIKTFIYHEPTDIQPEHPPDNVLNPERWEFYDYDLNKVREDLSKPVLIAGGKNRDEFHDHEEFMNMMNNYFDRQKAAPQLGEYDPQYNLIEKRLKIPNFKQYLLKDLIDPIEKPKGDVDGDNLILNPDRLKKRLPNIKLKKYAPREKEDLQSKKKDLVYVEELKIDPKIEVIRPRLKGFVDIKKQLKRPDYLQERKQIKEKDVIDMKVQFEQIEPHVKGNMNMKGQEKRPDGPQKKEQEVEVNLDK